mmetsp:Transcript_18914/g.43990  ORF Transcript_18914/g.43990 Transcript_18914/m.43990 type:complete len:377 (-) Transcript_18914:82-1212(-)
MAVVLEEAAPRSDRRLLVSILVVIGIAISQCAATQFAKAAQNDFGDAVESPLFMTWSSTIFNVALALPALVQSCASGEADRLGACKRQLLLPGPPGLWTFGRRGFLARAFLFYALWLLANYSYQYSLKLAPTGLVAALFSTTPAYVAIASIFLLARPLPRLGWAAVCLTIAGSVLVVEPWHRMSAPDSGSSATTVFTGLLLAVMAAVAASAYKVLFKFIFGDPPPAAVGVILSWIGIYAATFGSVLLWAILGWQLESVKWSHLPWQSLWMGNIASLAFNFLIGWGLAISYPLFISLGTVLSVPLNGFADWALRRILPDLVQSGGMLCIVMGFVLLVYCDTLQRSAAPAPPAAEQIQQQQELMNSTPASAPEEEIVQ